MKALILALTCVILSGAFQLSSAQYQPPPRKELRSTNGVWFGIYTKYHFNEKWAYYGEYHLRRKDGLQKMGQIYLRVGATYKVAKYLDLTVGFVNPYYWAPNPEEPNMDKVVPQYRGWQQAVLATPFDHIKVMHQFRLEQRFRRDYRHDAPFKLTHRFRYKITAYLPLNHKDFGPGTLFMALYNEIFIQAGKSVVYNHFEDNRAFIGLGYNLNRSIQLQSGYMYSFRHDGAPHRYENRNIIRFNIIHHLDFHLERQPKARDIPIH